MSCTYCTGFVTDATLLVSVVFRDEVLALIRTKSDVTCPWSQSHDY
jgi:hypothetical protein